MTAAVSIEHLTVAYENTQALHDVSLTIEEGEFVGIIGPNGGGKSTLVKSILGLVPIASGTIRLFGGPVKENRSAVGYVPQFAEVDRSFPISVMEVVLTAFLKGGLHPFFHYREDEKKRAFEELQRLGISRLANRQIAGLSGGEFQRVLIARALVNNPRLLLLDEPDASIDPASREHIYQLLAGLNKKITIVLVTHNHTAVSSAVTSLICLNRELIYHGTPAVPEQAYYEMYGGLHV